jgi:hypothetical protein
MASIFPSGTYPASSKSRKFDSIKTTDANYLLGGTYFDTYNTTANIQSLLNFYSAAQPITFTFTSATNTNLAANITWPGTVSRIGNKVLLHLPAKAWAVNAVAGATLTSDATAFAGALAAFLPNVTAGAGNSVTQAIYIISNGTDVKAKLSLDSTGVLVIKGDANFTASQALTSYTYELTYPSVNLNT